MIQIHPQPSNWWQVKTEFATDHAQCCLKLSYDNDGARIAQSPRWDTVEGLHCNKTQDIPLGLLVVSASSLRPLSPTDRATEREETFGHWWQLLGSNSSDGVIELSAALERNTAALHPCPVLTVSLQALTCAAHTRTQFEVQNTMESDWGAIRHIAPLDLPQRNCSVPATSLPPRIFLTPIRNYSFSLQVYPNTGEQGFHTLHTEGSCNCVFTQHCPIHTSQHRLP